MLHFISFTTYHDYDHDCDGHHGGGGGGGGDISIRLVVYYKTVFSLFRHLSKHLLVLGGYFIIFRRFYLDILSLYMLYSV